MLRVQECSCDKVNSTQEQEEARHQTAQRPVVEVSSVLVCRLCHVVPHKLQEAGAADAKPLRYRRSAIAKLLAAEQYGILLCSPLQLHVTSSGHRSVKPLGQQGTGYVHWASTDTAFLPGTCCASARLAPLLSAARRSPQHAPAAHAAASAARKGRSHFCSTACIDIADAHGKAHLHVHVLLSSISEGSLSFHVLVTALSKCSAAPVGRAKTVDGLLEQAHDVEFAEGPILRWRNVLSQLLESAGLTH